MTELTRQQLLQIKQFTRNLPNNVTDFLKNLRSDLRKEITSDEVRIDLFRKYAIAREIARLAEVPYKDHLEKYHLTIEEVRAAKEVVSLVKKEEQTRFLSPHQFNSRLEDPLKEIKRFGGEKPENQHKLN